MNNRHAPIISDVRGKILLIDGKPVTNPDRGGKPFLHADYGDLHLVVFYPGDRPNTQNVQAYDARGLYLWKAEPRAPGNYEGSDFYLYISYGEDGKTYLMTYSDGVCEVDLETGKVIALQQGADGKWSRR